jgi:hypothetical protein
VNFILYPSCQPSPVGPYQSLDCKSHTTYARRLASYIKDASTIRARTLDEYGQSPTLDRIKEMLREIALEKTMHDYGEAIAPSDAIPEPPPYIPPDEPPVLPKDIVTDVAHRFRLSYDAVVSASRKADVKRVRFLLVALFRARGRAAASQFTFSNAQIGKWLGGRDHSTIRHAEQQWPELAKRHPRYAEVYREYITAWGLSPISE